jgi:hypothetical protein
MLIEQIDAVGSQSLERVLNDLLDMFGFAVQTRKPTACLQIYVPAELRRDPDFVSKWLYGLPEDPLVLPRTVGLCSIKET